jgi:hypothetical protein
VRVFKRGISKSGTPYAKTAASLPLLGDTDAGVMNFTAGDVSGEGAATSSSTVRTAPLPATAATATDRCRPWRLWWGRQAVVPAVYQAVGG